MSKLLVRPLRRNRLEALLTHVIFILIGTFGAGGNASVEHSTSRSQGQETVSRFFNTGRGFDSDFAQVAAILNELVSGEINITQANHLLIENGLDAQVSLETEEDRRLLWASRTSWERLGWSGRRFSQKSNQRQRVPQEYELSRHPGVQYVLALRNPRFLNDVFLGLVNGGSLASVMEQLKLVRISFYDFGNPSQMQSYLLVKSKEISDKTLTTSFETGLALIYSDRTSWGDFILKPESPHSDVYFSYLWKIGETTRALEKLLIHFYDDLHPSLGDEVSADNRTGLLRSLNFDYAERLVPEASNPIAYFVFYYFRVFAAMGFRFDPSANNRGYFRPMESGAERILHFSRLQDIEQIRTGKRGPDLSHFEQVAAAFRVLDEHRRFPELKIQRGFPEVDEFFVDCIRMAKKVRPEEFVQAINDIRRGLGVEASCESALTSGRKGKLILQILDFFKAKPKPIN